MTTKPSSLPSGALLVELRTAVSTERASTVRVVELIAEVERRKLYVPEGYSSMFSYCVGELRLSDDAAGMRLAVARASQQFPRILTMLADGSLHLTGAAKLAKHMTAENSDELLAAGELKSKRSIEALLAERFPEADVPLQIRPLGPATPTPSLSVRSDDVTSRSVLPVPGRVAPCAAAELVPEEQTTANEIVEQPSAPAPALLRFALQGTITERTRRKMRRVQDLLGYRVSPGDLDALLDYMCDAAVEKLEKQRCAATSQARVARNMPSSDPRHIPAEVVREVWKRDESRCTFVSASGKRCSETKGLEIHHILEVARGGTSILSNLELRCRAHNQYEAEQAFGIEFMNGKRESAQHMRKGAQ